MNNSKLLLAPAVLTAGLLAGCHHDHEASTPPPSASQSLDTAQVLALAQQTSETAQPFAVNGGAVTLNDAYDDTKPIAVNTM